MHAHQRSLVLLTVLTYLQTPGASGLSLSSHSCRTAVFAPLTAVAHSALTSLPLSPRRRAQRALQRAVREERERAETQRRRSSAKRTGGGFIVQYQKDADAK